MQKEQILSLAPYSVKTIPHSYMVGSLLLSRPSTYEVRKDTHKVLKLNDKKLANDYCGLLNGAARSGVLNAINMLENNQDLHIDNTMYALNPAARTLSYDDDVIYTFKTNTSPETMDEMFNILNKVYVEYLSNHYYENLVATGPSFS